MATIYDTFPILVQRAPAASPFTFTTIAEIQSVNTFPALVSNEADASIQNSNIDKYVVSQLQRRKPIALSLNWAVTDGSQDQLTGLYFAKINASYDGYKFLHNASGLTIIASGQLTALEPKTPKEGVLQLDVTLRLSGPMYHQGLLIS